MLCLKNHKYTNMCIAYLSCLLGIIVITPNSLTALGDPPQFDDVNTSKYGFLNPKVQNSDLPPIKKKSKKQTQEENEKKTQSKEQKNSNSKNIESATLEDASKAVLINQPDQNEIESVDDREGTDLIVLETPTEQSIDDQKRNKKKRQLLKRKQFKLAAQLLSTVPVNQLTMGDQRLMKKLQLFNYIEEKASKNVKLFGKDESIDEETLKTTDRLYKAAQLSYIEENNNLAQDLLVQALYLDRRHFRAKSLMKYGLKKPRGTYKIENLERKYWQTSLTNFYSGYPEKAIKDLTVLAQFEPENALVFERMGSAYYSMGKPKEAIESWKRALYLNPDNKELRTFILNAEKEVKRQNEILNSILAKKKKKKQLKVTENDKVRILGVYNDSNKAYSFAQEVRQELKTNNILVEERLDGKWEVKVIDKGVKGKETKK